MTVTFPDGTVDTLAQGPGAPSADTAFASAGTLTALASAYQLAQYRVSRNAERAAEALWAAQRPLTDAQLSSWMSSWNSLLAGQAASQSQLTGAYTRASLSRFGVQQPTVMTVPAAVPTGVNEWLDGPYGRAASAPLRAQVVQARDALAAGKASVAQSALADRVPWLHSPVIKQRWRVSEGTDFTTALDLNSSFVRGATYDAGRAVERITMGAQSWPSFKNGVAMLYRRVPQATACGWCRLVATRLYSLASFKATGSGSSAAWHGDCRCTWAPITFGDAKTYADALSGDGDYYAAASKIGLWTGDPPADYKVVERARATTPASDRGAAPAAPGTRTPTARPETPTAPARTPGAVNTSRLATVEAQIASYQPIIDAGRGTTWMTAMLGQLTTERDRLRAAL